MEDLTPPHVRFSLEPAHHGAIYTPQISAFMKKEINA